MSESGPSNETGGATGNIRVHPFYQKFLPIIAQKTGAIGAIAWDCSTLPYRVIGQHVAGGQQVAMGFAETEHNKLLKRSAEGKQAVLFAEVGSEAEPQTIALTPMQRDGRVEVIEVVFSDVMDEDQRQAIVGSLSTFCRAADELVRNNASQANQSQPQSGVDASTAAINSFAASVNRSLDLKTTAFNIANELQSMVDCDRVAVLKRHGNRFKSLAFSGHSELAARSNMIRALEAFTDSQLRNPLPLWYPGEEIADRKIQQAFDLYRGHSNFQELALLPLFEKPASKQEDGSQTPDQVSATTEAPVDRGQAIGAVVIENFTEKTFQDRRFGIGLLQQHSDNAFRNAYAHQNLPFFGFVNWLGKLSSIRFSQSRTKWLTLGLVGLLVVLALILIPIEFKVVADGELLPEQRQNVYAEVNGEVTNLLVEHGQSVTAGTPLIELRSDELDIYIEDLNGKISSTRRQMEAIDQARLKAEQRGASSTDTSILNVEREKLGETLNSLLNEQTIIDQRKQKLNIRSQIDGKVLSWRLENQLEGRPVTRGQRLLEIANLEGPWMVELDLPDKDVGKILRAVRESDEPLRVTFILATDSAKTLEGELLDVAKSTRSDPVVGQSVQLKVKIVDPDLEFRQVRTDVRARIHCGKRSIGYVWLHDFFEFVQSKVLFRIF